MELVKSDNNNCINKYTKISNDYANERAKAELCYGSLIYNLEIQPIIAPK